MKAKAKYVGLDVHKDTTVVADGGGAAALSRNHAVARGWTRINANETPETVLRTKRWLSIEGKLH